MKDEKYEFEIGKQGLAEQVGSQGKVVAIDNSQEQLNVTMVSAFLSTNSICLSKFTVSTIGMLVLPLQL